MKKYMAAAVLSYLSVSSAVAYDGTINFTGKVVDQTCTVSTASKNLTVTLPTVSKTALSTAAKTAALTPFAIELTGCNTGAEVGAKKVKAYFEPNATTDFTTGNLTSSGSAKNVQVQLLNFDGTTPVRLGMDVVAQNVTATPVDTANVKLRYNAQYFATGVATAGNVAATVNFTVAYE
ncbi:fimbrial protein [Salmonella enterica subsp. enterica]|nr:fimbrial protein [Salmonella enterica subsp. enterica serovar Eastbourne]EDQ6181035.1 fimbrial protein [Salmonella enterica subsp. enterica serovar Javiana]EDR2881887.1 fimbrial protein [Salmonella enterica subsp. enterica]EDW0165464.1 fimbrial protein [Salmonella enterica subsp. enterica serovar Javiana]EME8577332.1 fimbrial protein [Salmonella enterica]